MSLNDMSVMYLNDMSCVVTCDMSEIYEILSLLSQQNSSCKKYAELKAKKFLLDYEFQQKK